MLSLQPISKISPVNLILKYADDTNLLVPQCSDTSILDEFEAI